MSAVILRRRKLGKGSASGIIAASAKAIQQVRHWADPLPANVSHIFRWGCTASINAPSDTADSVVIVNTAQAIHWCSDKRDGRLAMQAAGVPVPQTWATEDLPGADDLALTELLVSRPGRHAQGRNLSVGNFMDVHRYPGGYISRLIPKVAEYRVMVVQNRVAWVAQKTPGNPDDVAWNVARGGRFDNVRWSEWPIEVVKAALAAAKVSKTDFCGVDVMDDAQGKPYVLEVNSAPSQTSPYRQSCVAKCFDYIIENGKEALPDPEKIKTYKSVIHPAIRPNKKAM